MNSSKVYARRQILATLQSEKSHKMQTNNEAEKKTFTSCLAYILIIYLHSCYLEIKKQNLRTENYSKK
ncbi:CLUMA_CG009787, isoform A [Clunio marinus]|uniref:CLUMA_CG009787, isoform A n=1 Tax=Clunio marinus TaxID=568069 RepID=A0A1J1I9F9_9DIPT|nr:CLUMA_CG009787, isoform A [Clunio marinus]